MYAHTVDDAYIITDDNTYNYTAAYNAYPRFLVVLLTARISIYLN